MRNCVMVVMVAAIAVAACNDSNAPSARQQLTIYDIHVPASAGFTDSIHISFSYARAGCDSAVAVETRPAYDGIRFVVTSMTTDRPCTLDLPVASIVQSPIVYVVPPPHAVPFTARFDQPGTADSVRVVAAP